MTIDYQQAKIYKLTAGDLVYYGSTCSTLYKRMSIYKTYHNKYLQGKYPPNATTQLFNLGNVDISLVESFPCQSRSEMLEREAFFITNYECVNKNFKHQSLQSQYYKDNKEHLNERRLIHYLKKSYDFISHENIDVWKKHKSIIRKVRKELSQIQDEKTKEEIIKMMIS